MGKLELADEAWGDTYRNTVSKGEVEVGVSIYRKNGWSWLQLMVWPDEES